MSWNPLKRRLKIFPGSALRKGFDQLTSRMRAILLSPGAEIAQTVLIFPLPKVTKEGYAGSPFM